MENLLFHQQQLRGWQDHDQSQTYNSLYTKITLAKNQKLCSDKNQLAASKLPSKDHTKLSSKYGLNYKHHHKPVTQVKFRGSYELQNDKKILLRYLQNQPDKSQLKSHYISLDATESKLICRKESESLMTHMSVDKKNKELVILSSFQTPNDKKTFNELLSKLPRQLKRKKKRSLGNGKNDFENKCQTKKKNYRTRHAINFSKKSSFKKENTHHYYDVSRVQQKSQMLSNKIKQFPLFFRQIEWRQQNHSRHQQKPKKQLNIRNKLSRSEMSMSLNSPQSSLGQFLDSKMFTNKIRV